MTLVAGRNRVNRPYFFTDVDGDRVEFPAFGTGQGDLIGHDLRMFQMYVTAKQIEATATMPPDAFGPDDWSVEAGEDEFIVTIDALPNSHGLELTNIVIRVDGTDITLVDAETGEYPIPVDPGEYSIDIAATTSYGTGAWSAPKTVEVEA